MASRTFCHKCIGHGALRLDAAEVCCIVPWDVGEPVACDWIATDAPLVFDAWELLCTLVICDWAVTCDWTVTCDWAVTLCELDAWATLRAVVIEDITIVGVAS
jgi:hypothetical protein